MQGYYNRPEETARAFTDDGWLRTGDLGYLDENGYIRDGGVSTSANDQEQEAQAAGAEALRSGPRSGADDSWGDDADDDEWDKLLEDLTGGGGSGTGEGGAEAGGGSGTGESGAGESGTEAGGGSGAGEGGV